MSIATGSRLSSTLMAGMAVISAGAIALNASALPSRVVSAPRVALTGIGSTIAGLYLPVDQLATTLAGVAYSGLLDLHVPVPLAAQPYVLTSSFTGPVSYVTIADLGAFIDGETTLPQALADIGSTIVSDGTATLQEEQQALQGFPQPATAAKRTVTTAATIQPAATPSGLPDLGIGEALQQATLSATFLANSLAGAVTTELEHLGVPVPLAAQPYVLSNDLIKPIVDRVVGDVGGVIDGTETIPQALADIGNAISTSITATAAQEQQALRGYPSSDAAVAKTTPVPASTNPRKLTQLVKSTVPGPVPGPATSTDGATPTKTTRLHSTASTTGIGSLGSRHATRSDTSSSTARSTQGTGGSSTPGRHRAGD